MDQIEELKALHYEFRVLLISKDWKKLNKRMKHIRFNHDVNRSNTVLIATQEFVNHPEIKDERYKLYQSFNNDMKMPQKEWPIIKNNDPNVPENFKT